MTTTRTLRARTPEDVLALVPYVLGFHPADSLVLLTCDPRSQTCHARIDLPDDETDVAEVVRVLLKVLMRSGARRVAIVAYSTDHQASLATVRRLREACASRGVDVPVTLRADGERWYPLSPGAADLDGDQGRAYDVRCHPVSAQAVLEGQVTLGSRRELAESLLVHDRDAVAQVQVLADRATRRLSDAARHPLGPARPERARALLRAEGLWVRERLRRYLVEGLAPDNGDVARLLAALRSIEVRDVAWAEMDRDNAGRHVEVWRGVLQRTPHDLAAAPAALLAFAAWLAGDGALAWCALERCWAVDPSYRMAGLLSAALVEAMPPSTWRSPVADDLSLFST